MTKFSCFLALIFLALAPLLASCHFQLISPKARGFDEDKLGNFPCGGQDKVSTTRSDFPLNGGGNIQLDMEHDRSGVQVLLGLGDNPGSNFNIVLVPTVQEQGIPRFCLGSVPIPSSLNIKDGQTATIQVVTNGDPSGGLYNCADITFRSSATPGPCQNSSGVSVSTWTGSVNANGTGGPVGSSSSSTPSSGSTSSGSSSSSSSSTAGAAAAGTPSSTTTSKPSMAASSLVDAVDVWVWILMGIVGGAVVMW